MLQEDGTITFVTEIVEAVNSLLAEYENAYGPIEDELERGLALSYLLGVMLRDVERCWDQLATHPAFGGTHPKLVFGEQTEHDIETDGNAHIARALQARGWLPRDG